MRPDRCDAMRATIAAATLEQARAWIDTPDRFTHCLHVLGMDDAPDGDPEAIRWAGALQCAFCAILAAEWGRTVPLDKVTHPGAHGRPAIDSRRLRRAMAAAGLNDPAHADTATDAIFERLASAT